MISILVVDDYVVTQRVLSAQLRKGGYEVTVAGNGYEALSYLKERHFDLAIVDVAMPDMDGITLVEQIQANHGEFPMPIIVLTASVLDEDRERARRAGAADFLTKPISSWELLAVVERQLTAAPVC